MNNIRDICSLNFINTFPNISGILGKCNNHTHFYYECMVNLPNLCNECHNLYCDDCFSKDGRCILCIHNISKLFCDECNCYVCKTICYLCNKLVFKCRSYCKNDTYDTIYEIENRRSHNICYECFEHNQ